MKTSILLIFILVIFASTSRVKRKVVFRKNSKFFVRINGKEPIFNYTTIFAHGWGFKLNFDLPDSIPKLNRFYRRDVGDDLQSYFEKPELVTFFCILKYFMKKYASLDFGKYCGVLCEISEIIKGHDGDDTNFLKELATNIQNYNGNCPDFQYEMSLYTDI